MAKTLTRYLAILMGLIAMTLPVMLHAEKYAGEIFYMSPGVANQAMGNTGLTNADAISQTWWNPALLALQSSKGVELMHAEQFDGLMQYNHLSAVLGTQNKFGLVIAHIGIDDIALTKLENDSLPPSDTNRPFTWKRVNNNDLTAYFGVSRSVRDNLHLGITPKLAYRSMAEKAGYGFGADLGLLWEINEALKLGFVARDFFSTQVIWENGTQENVLPSANLELGLKTHITGKKIPLHLAAGLETMLEGRKEAATLYAGDFSADIHAGMAVLPIPQLKLMAGYDVDAVTTGVGIMIKNLFIDYAIKLGSKEDLGYSQRVSAGWRW